MYKSANNANFTSLMKACDERDVAESERDAARSACDAALAELGQVRAEREIEKKNTDAVYDEVYRALTKVQGERNAAVKRAEACEAKHGQAVAALQEARDGIATIYQHIDQDREIKAMKACKPICDRIDALVAETGPQAAVTTWNALVTENRRLHAEVAQLKQAEERDAEYLRGVLRKVDEEQKGLAMCSWCALPTNSDEESKRAHQMTCPKSPIVALLGRAVAALRLYHAWQRCEVDGDAQLHAFLSEMSAILADTTATHAADAPIDIRPSCITCGVKWLPPEGVDARVAVCDTCDAWRAQQEERTELEAVANAARDDQKNNSRGWDRAESGERVQDALAALDEKGGST